jgi:carboxyvinyl-carboxyphosphonate phosphorylmutase
LILGGSGDVAELCDLDYLASRRVRVLLQGHWPIRAAVLAVHESMKALRAGTPPSRLAGLAPSSMISAVTRSGEYRRWMTQFLGAV